MIRDNIWYMELFIYHFYQTPMLNLPTPTSILQNTQCVYIASDRQRMFGDIFASAGSVSDAVFKHTEYTDKDGYTVIVLSDESAGTFSLPWWSWLVLGVALIIILLCCMGWGMGLDGERTVR